MLSSVSPSMDALDAKILEILRADARTSNVKMAERLGITEGTVRHRIRRLVANRTIRAFTVDAEESATRAIVLVRVQPERAAAVVRSVRGLAQEIFETAGPYDVAALLRCEDMEHLNTRVDQIRAIRGVIETQTLVGLTAGARARPPPAPGQLLSPPRGR